jgi:alginate O-acetyltransferase complex protein AlgJ
VSGRAEGRLEAVVDGRALGWAWDPERPEQAVEVEVVVDGRPVASGVADVERPILVEAGMGDGRYGFYVPLPEDLSGDPLHTIRVTAGPNRDRVLPIEGFETMVRTPDPAWSRTTFVPEGAGDGRTPFVPEAEPPVDPGEAALVGRRDWLFLRDDANLTAEQLAGAPLLLPEDVERRCEALAERHRSLRELRIPYLFAAAPMKERVYGRFLPEGLALHPRHPVKQLNAALRRLNGGDVLDLLPALRDGRRDGRVFPRTDSNWSARGAFFAYRELIKEAGKRVIDLDDPLLPGEAAFVSQPGFRGDLAAKPKLAAVDGELAPVEPESELQEEIAVTDVSRLRALRMPAPQHLEVTPGHAPRLYEIPDEPRLPRAVLVGDACCPPLIPWLAEHFRRLVFLWTPEPPLEAIELEMPDVVIHVVSERLLVHGP